MAETFDIFRRWHVVNLLVGAADNISSQGKYGLITTKQNTKRGEIEKKCQNKLK
ncbi:MAG TPA: hypothetical protein VF884_10240 [Nitrososphaeraceae archaeon]